MGNQQITENISTSELLGLIEIVDKHDLISQLVRQPTRKQLQTQNILDLVLANNRNTISDCNPDHDIVRFSINLRCRRKINVKQRVTIIYYSKKRTQSDLIRKEM